MESAPDQDAAQPLRGLLKDPDLHVVFAVTLMVVLGVASVAPVLPRAARALEVGPGQIALVITAYTLPGVFLTPVLGVIADRVGRKQVLVPGLLLFAGAGAACALARDLEVLLALRFLQGIGAGPLGALNLALVGDLYKGRRRAAALGYNQTVLSMGAAAYPALGGVLGALAWYAPFALPLLAVPVALAVVFVLEVPPATEEALDLGEYLRGLRQTLADRRVLGLFAVTLVTFVLLYGAVITYLPILMDERFGSSSTVIGIVTAVQALASGLAATQIGRLVTVMRQTSLVALGFVAYAVAGLLFPVLPAWWLLFLPSVVFGVGMGLNLPVALNLITGLVPAEHRAAVLALNGTVLRLGQTVGPVAVAGAFAAGGFAGVYVGLAALAAAVAVAVWWGFRDTGL